MYVFLFIFILRLRIPIYKYMYIILRKYLSNTAVKSKTFKTHTCNRRFPHENSPQNHLSQFQVTLTILDENDEHPRFVDNQCLSAAVDENSAVGTVVCAVLAVDDDDPNNGNSDIEYYLVGENAGAFEFLLTLVTLMTWISE